MTKQKFIVFEVINNTISICYPFITNLNKYDNTLILYFFEEFIKYMDFDNNTRLVAKGQYNDYVVYHNHSFYCMH